MIWIARRAGVLALAGSMLALGALSAILLGPLFGSTEGTRDSRLVVRAAPCEFQGGFKTVHDLLPKIVGDCLEDERHVANGDGLQSTTNGLLVWRKADNWTAFTDGTTTWINGPLGLQSRLNSERFPWEASVSQQSSPPPVPDAAQPLIQQAVADAAKRTGVDPSAVTVVAAQPRDWPDSSLGCPKPGQFYAQVIIPGYLILLDVGGQRLEYHTDSGRRVELC